MFSGFLRSLVRMIPSCKMVSCRILNNFVLLQGSEGLAFVGLSDFRVREYTYDIIIIIIGIQSLGRSGQRPEFSQATGMALVRCNLGKFLGVACHCFPRHL